MKNVLFIIFALMLVSCGSNEYLSPVTSFENVYEGVDESFTLSPYSNDNSVQLASKYDDQNNLIEQGFVFLGAKDGMWSTYDYKFRRMDLVSIYNYKDGVKHGPYLVYENGSNLKEKGNYYGGQLHGLQLQMRQGKVLKETNFHQGQINGMVKSYYDNGTTLKEEGEFVNGQREGVHKWYDQEGNVKIQYTYKNGKMQK